MNSEIKSTLSNNNLRRMQGWARAVHTSRVLKKSVMNAQREAGRIVRRACAARSNPK
jgi:hypothetical protein